MTAMEPPTASDLLFLAAPIAGALVDFLLQIVVGRLFPRLSLMPLIIVTLAGGAATGLVLIAAAVAAAGPALDSVALAVTAFLIYGAGGFFLFALINLGETSLRIRMLGLLMAAPAGLKEQELVAMLGDDTVIPVRLERLRSQRQARYEAGVYYSRPSILFVAAAGIRLARRLIYGRPSSAR